MREPQGEKGKSRINIPVLAKEKLRKEAKIRKIQVSFKRQQVQDAEPGSDRERAGGAP